MARQPSIAVEFLSSPVARVGVEVESLARSTFAGANDAVYVSTPITTGKEYFELLTANGSVSDSDRARLRSINAMHATDAMVRVRDTFPTEVIIDPLSFNEPAGWSQDHFNAFWMLVIHHFVKTVVVVNGWEYSTGCTWEVSQALFDELPILDERLHPLGKVVLARHITEAARTIGEDTTWVFARDAALSALSTR